MTMIDLVLCFVFHDSSALPVHNDINREGRKCQNIPQLSGNLALVKPLKKKKEGDVVTNQQSPNGTHFYLKC